MYFVIVRVVLLLFRYGLLVRFKGVSVRPSCMNVRDCVNGSCLADNLGGLGLELVLGRHV